MFLPQRNRTSSFACPHWIFQMNSACHYRPGAKSLSPSPVRYSSCLIRKVNRASFTDRQAFFTGILDEQCCRENFRNRIRFTEIVPLLSEFRSLPGNDSAGFLARVIRYPLILFEREFSGYRIRSGSLPISAKNHASAHCPDSEFCRSRRHFHPGMSHAIRALDHPQIAIRCSGSKRRIRSVGTSPVAYSGRFSANRVTGLTVPQRCQSVFQGTQPQI